MAMHKKMRATACITEPPAMEIWGQLKDFIYIKQLAEYMA